MAENSKIEWTDTTWNPLAGCTAISPGCTNCYAATMARRLEAMGQDKYAGTAERRGSVDVFTGRINIGTDESIREPMTWAKPRRVFVNSMSDLFHDGASIEFIARVFAMMIDTPRHTYQVLTKRAERMAELTNCQQFWTLVRQWMKGNHWQCATDAPVQDSPIVASNVWLGVSCEDQVRTSRLEYLRKCPAAVRFISFEPLLGLIACDLTGIQWAIVGGESGRHARPMHPQWATALRDQCQSAGVKFFYKQWGECAPYVVWENSDFADASRQFWMNIRGSIVRADNSPGLDWTLMGRVGKKVAGRLLDGREWNEFPESVVA